MCWLAAYDVSEESGMTRKILGASAALLLAMMPIAGHAADPNFAIKTTGDLVALCDPDASSSLAGAAIGFCQGFAEGAVTVERVHDAANKYMRPFCLPDPLPGRTDAMTAFVAWARAQPDRLTTKPEDGLFAFLGEKYPCSSKH
jgi:hypothetical protein